MNPFKKPMSVRKATNYAIVINGLQIALILVMLLSNNPMVKNLWRRLIPIGRKKDGEEALKA